MRSSQRPPRRLVAGLFIVGAAVWLLLVHAINQQGEANQQAYLQARIDGTVERVLRFNRGFPILRVNGQRWYINRLPPAFGHYVRPGDSIVKQADSYLVTSYRRQQAYLVRTRWQYAVRNGLEQPLITKDSVRH